MLIRINEDDNIRYFVVVVDDVLLLALVVVAAAEQYCIHKGITSNIPLATGCCFYCCFCCCGKMMSRLRTISPGLNLYAISRNDLICVTVP